MISTEFEDFIIDFNQIIKKAKSDGSFLTKENLTDFTNKIESKLNEALRLYQKDLDQLFAEKRVYLVLDQMKFFCNKFGRVTYALDHVNSEIRIKKGKRWIAYKTISVEAALMEYFGITQSDPYYSFIGSYLSTEENFTLIQVFNVFFIENTQLN
jgi:hypothetical protein